MQHHQVEPNKETVSHDDELEILDSDIIAYQNHIKKLFISGKASGQDAQQAALLSQKAGAKGMKT